MVQLSYSMGTVKNWMKLRYVYCSLRTGLPPVINVPSVTWGAEEGIEAFLLVLRCMKIENVENTSFQKIPLSTKRNAAK